VAVEGAAGREDASRVLEGLGRTEGGGVDRGERTRSAGWTDGRGALAGDMGAVPVRRETDGVIGPAGTDVQPDSRVAGAAHVERALGVDRVDCGGEIIDERRLQAIAFEHELARQTPKGAEKNARSTPVITTASSWP
jgi:hypothetical protein